MLKRSVFRMIRKSLGRYLAILAIIALGVGFFAGLRVTEEAMVKTADGYIREGNLFDFRLISTLGFTESDVKAFSDTEGITAYGSVSADLLYVTDSGSDAVLHAHTLLDGVNGIDLLTGTLPSRADECLLDAKYASENDIGKKIRLSDSNSKDNADLFAYREYTVTGLVNATYYMSFERGTTSLGNGTVSGFIYLLPSGFACDYYTELFLSIEDSGTYAIYSDAYTAAVDSFRVPVESLLDRRAELRYTSLYEDALKEIADAEAELEQRKAELADAEEQLSIGKATLIQKRAEAEAAFEEAQSQLALAAAALAIAEQELEEAKQSPYADLPEVQAVIRQKEQELQENKALYASELAAFASARSEAEAGFAAAEAELSENEEKIENGKQELKDGETALAEAKEEVDQRILPATTFALDRSSNVGYASFENDTKIVSGVARVFPLFFFLVAALVCITTLTRMVSEQRTENGVLKALGFGNGAIVSRYLFYAGSASVIGCILGFLLGSKLMPIALWQVYHILYAINRPIAFLLDWNLFLLCSALYLFCALGATALVCYRELREVPAELIRPKAPAAGKRIFAERISFLWNRLKFLHKVSIRNIVRYKQRMFMMILGIGGCTALLLTGFGIRDSIGNIADNQFQEISHFDASVYFLTEPDEAKKEEFLSAGDGLIADAAFLYTGSVDLTFGDSGSSSVNLIVFDEDLDAFVDLHSGKDPVFWPQAGEAVINYRLAKEYGISVGDRIALRDADLRTLDLIVSGIFDNYIYDYVYVNAGSCVSAWGESPAENSAFLNFKEGQDVYAASAVLLGADNVASLTVNRDLQSRVSNMLQSLDYIVLIVLVCAGALAFIVLYNLTNISINERMREIATLKVLGFYQKETDAYVFRENLILTGISSLFGIPMGIALLHYVMAQIKISSMYFGSRIAPLSYLFAILLTFLFAYVVDFALTFKMKRINMAEALKTIE